METKDISLKAFIQEMLALVVTDFDDSSYDEKSDAVETDDSDSGSDNDVPAEKKCIKKGKKYQMQ